MVPELPPELLDIIIDYGYSDRRMLATCALVCKAWLQSSRYHLFRTTVIRGNPGNDLKHFIDLLDSELNTFGDHIQHLTLCEYDRLPQDPIEPQDGRPVIWTAIAHHTLCLVCMPSVTSLTISTDRLLVHRRFIKTPLHSLFPNVRDLAVKGVRFESSAQLMETISSFLCLERITSLMFACRLSADAEFAHCPVPAQLSMVSIDFGFVYSPVSFNSQHQILRWATSGSPMTGVHCLALQRMGVQDVGLVGEVLQGMGDRLEELELSFMRSRFVPLSIHFFAEMMLLTADLQGVIDLSHNHKLRIVHFKDAWGACNSTFPSSYPSLLLRLLRSVSATPQKLKLSFLMGSGYFTDDYKTYWIQIAEVLCRPQFSQLAELDICIHFRRMEHMDHLDYEGLIKKWLGEFERKGVLRVTFHDDDRRLD